MPVWHFYRPRFRGCRDVSVKALRHYERLGLLKPRRTPAVTVGTFRTDLERIEAIAALKYVGFPLDQVRSILHSSQHRAPQGNRRATAGALRCRGELAVARRAIDVADTPVRSRAGLNAIVESVQTQVAAAAMKRYYTEEGCRAAPTVLRRGSRDRVARAVRDAVGSGRPGSGLRAVQAAVDRWLALSIRAYTGDPSVQIDSPTAWADRARWPLRLKRRIDEFHLEEVHALVAEGRPARPKKYFNAAAWDRYVARRNEDPQHVSRAWGARVHLFREIETALDSGTADRQAEAFRARWDEQLESASGGDPAILDAFADDVGRRDTGRPRCAGRSRPSTGLRIRASSEGCGIPRADSARNPRRCA
jgi:DNA-binding transcriptional MerR regulator